MLIRSLTAWVLFVVAAAGSSGAAAHPQDGPHADLRLAIEGDLVRLSVGVNLAFLDEAIDVPREALGNLSDEESDRTLNGFRRLLLDGAACVINGQRVEPDFERLEIFTDPDPGMVAVFPRMGNRALIRAAAVLRYDAPNTAETVEVTWPVYPLDQLAQQMESGSGAPPRMYFEVIFTAAGRTMPARFTHAEPTIRWSRDESSRSDLLGDLPEPMRTGPTSAASVHYFVFGLALLLAAGVGVTRRSSAGRLGSLAAVLVIVALGTALRPRASVVPVVSEAEAREILLSIHESMYRAFDYTAESDIYDRLAFALDGELLGELYEQIRLSLLQAEEEMKVGVVTRLEPIETRIDAVDTARPDPIGLGFDATHRWRVDGTVYHWGHSHTRAHVYEAVYRIVYTDRGWRMTAHELRSQRRIDPADGDPIDANEQIRRMLDRLGQPDI